MLKSQYAIPNILQTSKNTCKKKINVNITKIKKVKKNIVKIPLSFIR